MRMLQTEFVPVSGDCKELQSGRSAARDWFMNIVSRVNDPDLREQLKPMGDEGNTAQGLYIVGADGQAYGWFNSHYPEGVIDFLNKGLAAFRKYPPSPVVISQRALTEHFSVVPHPTTSVIRVFTRIRPVPPGSNDLNNGIGRDHFWILQDEVKQILAASANGGRAFYLPQSLVLRLVRFHLIDNVRGEPDMWNSDEVRQASFSARLISTEGSVRHYEFSGMYSQWTADGRRGLQGTLEGMFDIAYGSTKLSDFRAFGQAQAWGASRFTEGAPAGRFHLVIAMKDTNDSISQIVPPEAVGDYDNADYLHPQLTQGSTE